MGRCVSETALEALLTVDAAGSADRLAQLDLLGSFFTAQRANANALKSWDISAVDAPLKKLDIRK